MDTPRKLERFFSEQYHKHKDDGILPEAAKPSRLPKSNFLRQISIAAEQKIDQLEQEAQLVDEMLHQPGFIRLKSVAEDEPINAHTTIIIEPVASRTVIETGVPARQLKTGSQRLRWNLLFNLLL